MDDPRNYRLTIEDLDPSWAGRSRQTTRRWIRGRRVLRGLRLASRAGRPRAGRADHAAKSTFVLNNQFGREMLTLLAVESALGTKVAIELPYDPFIYLTSVNQGVPIVLGAPRSPATGRLTELSAIAFGSDGVALREAEPRKPGRFAGFIRH